jgi:hypothetical protein
MTAELTPEPETRPYRPFAAAIRYDDLDALYGRIKAVSEGNIARWHAQAQKAVFDPERPPAARQPSRPRSHASSQVTQPDAVPVPVPAPAPVPPLRPSRWRTALRHGHSKSAPGPAVADKQPGPVPPPGTGADERLTAYRARHAATSGTPGHPAADGREADTLKPGDMKPVPAVDEAALRAADQAAAAVQAETQAALLRVPGVKPADLQALARPGDGRDATEQMTAVQVVPQQGEQQ